MGSNPKLKPLSWAIHVALYTGAFSRESDLRLIETVLADNGGSE